MKKPMSRVFAVALLAGSAAMMAPTQDAAAFWDDGDYWGGPGWWGPGYGWGGPYGYPYGGYWGGPYGYGGYPYYGGWGGPWGYGGPYGYW